MATQNKLEPTSYWLLSVIYRTSYAFDRTKKYCFWHPIELEQMFFFFTSLKKQNPNFFTCKRQPQGPYKYSTLLGLGSNLIIFLMTFSEIWWHSTLKVGAPILDTKYYIFRVKTGSESNSSYSRRQSTHIDTENDSTHLEHRCARGILDKNRYP